MQLNIEWARLWCIELAQVSNGTCCHPYSYTTWLSFTAGHVVTDSRHLSAASPCRVLLYSIIVSCSKLHLYTIIVHCSMLLVYSITVYCSKLLIHSITVYWSNLLAYCISANSMEMKQDRWFESAHHVPCCGLSMLDTNQAHVRMLRSSWHGCLCRTTQSVTSLPFYCMITIQKRRMSKMQIPVLDPVHHVDMPVWPESCILIRMIVSNCRLAWSSTLAPSQQSLEWQGSPCMLPPSGVWAAMRCALCACQPSQLCPSACLLTSSCP